MFTCPPVLGEDVHLSSVLGEDVHLSSVLGGGCSPVLCVRGGCSPVLCFREGCSPVLCVRGGCSHVLCIRGGCSPVLCAGRGGGGSTGCGHQPLQHLAWAQQGDGQYGAEFVTHFFVFINITVFVSIRLTPYTCTEHSE